MVSVINAFQINGEGRDCLYSSIHNVLLFLGFDLIEAEVFFAFQGLNTYYYNYKNDFFGINDMASQVQDDNLMNQYISVHKNSCNHELCEDDFYQHLKRGIPVICIMKVKNIGYHEVLAACSLDRLHVAVLFGIDSMADKAYIADAYMVDKLGNYYSFTGEASLKEIISATTGFFTIERRIQDCKKFNVKESFTQALASYTESNVRLEYASGHKAFTEYILNLKKYENDSKLYQLKCYEAYCTLKFISVQTYLSYICEILKQPEFSNASDFKDILIALEDNKSQWNKFSAELLQDSFKEKAKRNVDLLQSSTFIMEQQNEIFKKIVEKTAVGHPNS